MSEFHTTYTVPISGASLSSGQTTTSKWIPVATADTINLWYYNNTTASPTLTITADITIFPCKDENTAPTIPITGGNNYKNVTYTTGGTTTGAWVHVDTPAELLTYPVMWMRINVSSASAASLVYVAVAKNGW